VVMLLTICAVGVITKYMHGSGDER
jgi:hypothetical protein